MKEIYRLQLHPWLGGAIQSSFHRYAELEPVFLMLLHHSKYHPDFEQLHHLSRFET